MVDKKPDTKKEEEQITNTSKTLGFASPRLELKKTIWNGKRSSRRSFFQGKKIRTRLMPGLLFYRQLFIL